MSIESPKEVFWKEHQDSLRRIRTHLVSGKKSPSKSRTPVYGKRSPGSRGNHPPYGKYRRTPPPHLPRLDTPPEHEDLRSNRNLRRVRYEQVPPVRPRKAFKAADEDSWGEETEEEEEEEPSKPHPLPYPIYAPPPVVYGQPFPMYYPPPPRGAGRHQRRRDKKRKADKGYRDIYNDRRLRHSDSAAKRQGRRSKRQAGYPVPVHSYPGPIQNGYTVPMLNAYVVPVHTAADEDEGEDGEEEEPVHKPSYRTPRRQPQYAPVPALLLDTDEEVLRSEAHTYITKHPLFAEDFVSWFITDCLEEEIVPDVLIDALTELDKLPSEHPYLMPALRACDDFLTREVEQMTREVVHEVLHQAVNNYIDSTIPIPVRVDPLETFLTQLVDEVVAESCRSLVGAAIRDLAHDHLEDVMAWDILGDLIADEVEANGEELLEDAVLDIIGEDFLEDYVIGPEVAEESAAVAQDMIKHYDNKITKREMRAVKDKAGERLVDSLCLRHLLSLVAHQGKVWTESDFANRLMDEMMGNMLLQQYFGVRTNRDKTLHCRPLRKLHEKVVTEVALDVLLQQLTSSLDEDLADVDEYERDVNNSGGHSQLIPAVVR